jgi:excisionase family DNA binding protein
MPARTISLHQAADRLGVHYMTAYRYVRTGRLPARQERGQWRVDPADLRAVLASAGTAGRLGAMRPANARSELSRRLADRLVHGDEPGSWAIIEEALARGATPEEVVVDAVGTAMRSIGERWQIGELTVDDEHCASAVVSRLIARLGPLSSRRGAKRGTVVIGTPPRERHALPTALATNVLRGRGFEVVDLGADLPVDAFATAVAKVGRPLAAAIGVTSGNHDRDVRAMARAVEQLTPGVPVLVGGAAIAGAAHAARLGVRWAGGDARALVAAVESA